MHDVDVLTPPYLLFTADVDNLTYAKTAAGIIDWCPDRVAGQLRFAGNTLDLGVPDLTVEQAATTGVKSLVIGIAPVGGALSQESTTVITHAARQGLNIISGLHTRLEAIPGLVDIAAASGSQLINVRIPPNDIPVGSGQQREGQRVLMVGTDCAVGKKYTALALTNSLKSHDINATFRATGQTGIMIAGKGIPIDAVVSDFVSGAAELISPANDRDHWDVIEGQGSLFNPSYAGVSLGLLHGSQPDAIVVCHDAARKFICSCSGHAVPSIAECIDLNLRCARLTNPNVRCVGISINTSSLPAENRQSYLDTISSELSLPCIDSVIDGCDAIVASLLSTSNGKEKRDA